MVLFHRCEKPLLERLFLECKALITWSVKVCYVCTERITVCVNEHSSMLIANGFSNTSCYNRLSYKIQLRHIIVVSIRVIMYGLTLTDQSKKLSFLQTSFPWLGVMGVGAPPAFTGRLFGKLELLNQLRNWAFKCRITFVCEYFLLFGPVLCSAQ